MRSEVRGRSRAIKPIPPTYPNLNTESWDSKPNNYVLTEEQLAEVIAKYGAPTMPLSSRRRAMHMQRPKGKKEKE